MNEAGTANSGFSAFARRLDDGRLMRSVFFIMLAVVGVALFLDYRELSLQNDENTIHPGMAQPVLPPYVPARPDGVPSVENEPNVRPEVLSDPGLLRNPLAIDLRGGGILTLAGTIDPGAAARFEARIAEISEYVKWIELDSPGGSVRDALAISAKIRDLELNTRVNAGALCASSCPLVFAGGSERIASEKAAIGVHQVFSAGAVRQSTDIEVSGAQTATAKITRHLEAMGVDPALWLHALETPPRQLYYLSNGELVKYRLATSLAKPGS